MNARVVLCAALVAVLAGLMSLARAAAPAGRYTVANGTVYDAKTKLTWQQAVPEATYTWDNAKTYCAGLSLTGTGWRLPTAKELATLVDESRTNPAIDTTAFPSTPSGWFWSSSMPPSGAWAVSFSYGYVGYNSVSTTVYVRCVR